jgi:hypothetical protein
VSETGEGERKAKVSFTDPRSIHDNLKNVIKDEEETQSSEVIILMTTVRMNSV